MDEQDKSQQKSKPAISKLKADIESLNQDIEQDENRLSEMNQELDERQNFEATIMQKNKPSKKKSGKSGNAKIEL